MQTDDGRLLTLWGDSSGRNYSAGWQTTLVNRNVADNVEHKQTGLARRVFVMKNFCNTLRWSISACT